jgi:hypothetical protein
LICWIVLIVRYMPFYGMNEGPETKIQGCPESCFQVKGYYTRVGGHFAALVFGVGVCQNSKHILGVLVAYR